MQESLLYAKMSFRCVTSSVLKLQATLAKIWFCLHSRKGCSQGIVYDHVGAMYLNQSSLAYMLCMVEEEKPFSFSSTSFDILITTLVRMIRGIFQTAKPTLPLTISQAHMLMLIAMLIFFHSSSADLANRNLVLQVQQDNMANERKIS